jgi:anti-sigma B factor antagonist
VIAVTEFRLDFCQIVCGGSEMDTIHMTGEINLKTSPLVRDLILDQLDHKHDVDIDLSNVTVIDSSGLAVLVEAAANARKRGYKVHFTHISDACMKMIKLAHLERILLNDRRIHATAIH